MAELLSAEEALELMPDPVEDPIGGIEAVLQVANSRHLGAVAELQQKLDKVNSYADERDAEIQELRADHTAEVKSLQEDRRKVELELNKATQQYQCSIRELEQHLQKERENHAQELRKLRDTAPAPLAADSERLEFLERKAAELGERERHAVQLATTSADLLEVAYRHWAQDECHMERRLDLKREIPRIISRLRGVPEATVILPGDKQKPELTESEWADANP